MKNRHLIIFFAISLFWIWVFYFPIAIFNLSWNNGIGMLLFIAGGVAPSLAGIIMVCTTYDKKRKKDFVNRCIKLKPVCRQILSVMFLFSGVTLLSCFISYVTKNPMPEMQLLKFMVAKPYMIIPILFLCACSGPLNEELGWRGYALDQLIIRNGLVFGTFILGCIWTLWHLPWFFIEGQAQYNMAAEGVGAVLFYCLDNIGLSFIITYVYLKTERSILAAMLVHLSANLFRSQLMFPNTIFFNYTYFSITIAVSVICCIKLSRTKREDYMELLTGTNK